MTRHRVRLHRPVREEQVLPALRDQPARRLMIAAALEALKSVGFAGATAGAIARIGGFNQALIFYDFGSLDGLLLAALDATSEERLARYREAIAEARTVEELLLVAARVYAEDRDSGHTTVVSQMIAGSVARPDLAPAMVARMEPWIELCEGALEKVTAGVNLLTHLDEDRTRTDGLFARLEALAPLVASLETRPSGG